MLSCNQHYRHYSSIAIIRTFYRMILTVVKDGQWWTLYQILEGGEAIASVKALILISIVSKQKVFILANIGG